MSQPQGSIPPQAPQQVDPPQQFGPPQQVGPPPWQHGAGAIPLPWQQGPPLRPGYPVRTRPARPPVHGWWTASAVLAFIGAGFAASVLASIAVMAGYLLFLVAVMGGGEGLRQISDDFFSGSGVAVWIFLVFQVGSVVLGFMAGLRCLRAKTSGAVLSMLLGALSIGELVWCATVLRISMSTLVVLGLAALALIVCPVLALFHRQPKHR